MLVTTMIVCIQYNNPFPHPRLPPPGSFVFDTTIHIDIHIHARHCHDHSYLIQWSTLTPMFVTTMIICIHYNDSPLLLHAHIPIIPQWGPNLEWISAPRLGLSVVWAPQAQRLHKFGLGRAWWRCQRHYCLSVCTSLEFCHLRPPHGWNDIIGWCALSLHGICCPLPARWLPDCCMRWWAVFLLLLEFLW